MKKAMTIDMTFERREELIREEEREEGIKEGQAEIMDLSKWLSDQDRSSDYWKAIEDLSTCRNCSKNTEAANAKPTTPDSETFLKRFGLSFLCDVSMTLAAIYSGHQITKETGHVKAGLKGD